MLCLICYIKLPHKLLKCGKNVSDGRSMKSCVIYLTTKTNKISAPFQTVATVRIAPKICHGQHAWRPFFWSIEYLQYSPEIRANNNKIE